MKRHAPHVKRNRDPILEQLRRLLRPRSKVLEIASGTGEHCIHFAEGLKEVEWQPSDVDPVSLESIAAHVADSQLSNLSPPLRLDVHDLNWPVGPVDVVLCMNMIHIAPWSCTLALMAGAARVLSRGGALILYGPFFFQDRPEVESNVRFDAALRERDPTWGVRDIVDVQKAAGEHGFRQEALIAMPANNHLVLFRRG